MFPIGIMQGRLLPVFEGRFQAFPANDWEREFFLAQEAGLQCIEWIYETHHECDNPLGDSAGIQKIRKVSAETGVNVWSICADYYMQNTLLDETGTPKWPVVKNLEQLIDSAGELAVRYVVLPFVDASALRDDCSFRGLIELLRHVVPLAKSNRLELHLETDLPAARLIPLLENIGDPCVRSNYDIGNSASLGHPASSELPMLNRWIGSVHVKDRVLGGGTVPLGTGAADFKSCFDLIPKCGFHGPYILQAARQEGMSELELAKHNRRFAEDYLTGKFRS